jgi:predicted TPR repeat methyltransferase
LPWLAAVTGPYSKSIEPTLPATTVPPEPFGEAFFRRFYLNPKTRVVTQREMVRRANLIAAFVQHGELEVRSILDVGCGLGLLRDQLLRHFPKAKYTGLEVSQYLCDKHGWTQGSAHTFESPRPFDLVVCYDVFQYLPVRPAAAGLRNLARLSQGVLHFGALTREDWELYCDKRRTDRNVHIRPAEWYRKRLARSFINAGSGMFVRRGAPVHLWELDQVEVLRSRRGYVA